MTIESNEKKELPNNDPTDNMIVLLDLWSQIREESGLPPVESSE